MPQRPTGNSGVGHDEDLSPDQRRVLEDAYQRLVDLGKWPTYADLDHFVDGHGIEEPLVVMKSLYPTFLQGVGVTGTPSLSQELSLSLHGLLAVATWNAAALEDLRLFTKSVQTAVKISDRVAPPATARFHALEFLVKVFPGGPYESVALRLGQVWSAAGAHLWRNLGGVGTIEWTADLNQQNLRSYRQVRDIESLVAAEKERLARQFMPPIKETSHPEAAVRPNSKRAPEYVPDWVALLPSGFREALDSRLGDPNSDVINEGWIELAELIHRKTGLDLDVADLVNQAFGGKEPLVSLAQLTTQTGTNLHYGYTEILRGLARMRNVHAHRGRPPATQLHVAAIVLAMGECYDVISKVDDWAGRSTR